MLGMVRPNQPNPNIPPPASQQPQQAALPPQQTNVHAALPLPGQTDLKDHIKASQNPNSLRKPNQPMMPVSSTSIPSLNSQSHSLQSQILQSAQQPLNAQVTTMPVQQSTQFQSMPHPSLHSASPQLPSLPPPPMPSASIQSQQPLQTSGIPHMQLQPAMPSLPRPASIPAFGHQPNTQMGPNQPNPNTPPPASQQPQQAALPPQQTNVHAALPLPGQTDLKDHIKSGQNHPASMGHSMLRGHEPPRQSLYQGGSPHLGMEFNQTGGPMQAERGSSWIPGLRDNTTGTQNIPGPPSFMAGQMGPASQPPRPPALSSDMESALLQQVMSLTPEQINLLPLEQRNQVLQLQQIWGYFVGMEFNQTGGPMQAERGSSWIPGLRDNTTGTQNIPGPPSFMAGQMGPASQPPRPPALSSDMESALLQQVMSLTPEQINLLPLEQRNQVLQLQQIWGYFVGPDNKQRAAVSNLETNGTAATNIADIDAGAALTDRRERELEEENMADIKMEPDPVGAAVSNLETNGTAATNIADIDAGAALIDRRERESQDAAVSNLETNGTAATNIADIDAGAALTDRRERELEEELKQKLERKELEDDEQKLIGGFQHMLSNMYLFSNYVLAVSGGALSLLTKGPQCWMFVIIISFVVIFLIGMVLSLQLTYRQLRALQTKMNSLVEKRNQICPDTKNLELEYESRHCDINLLIFLVGGLMYAGFVLVMGYYLLCSESVNGLSYTPCVPCPHQTVPVESVPDHLLVSPWLPRKFLHQEM